MFRFLIIFLLLLAIFFRFFHLDYKVYWFDEVYTSFRAAGYTSQEIDRSIFQNRAIAPDALQKYQQIKPGSTAADTINSLAIEDPQHPPLYFLMARFWMQVFGNSLTASRALPALLSLLSLPLMYALARILFDPPYAPLGKGRREDSPFRPTAVATTKGSSATRCLPLLRGGWGGSERSAILATVILALSPVDILFAQTARQYSLLTVAIIGSSFLLLRALKASNWFNWSLYTLACTAGLYTHLFFGLTLIGQFIFIICHWLFVRKNRQILFPYLVAIASSFLLYIPWLLVLINNYGITLKTTNWATNETSFLDLLQSWLFSFTSLFIDLNFNTIWSYSLRLPLISLIIAAIYLIVIKPKKSTKIFIITSIFVPFLMLALPDLLWGDRRSTVTRYLISCFPGIQLAVGYFLANKIFSPKNRQFWRVVIILVFTGSILSCTVSAFSDTWWSKGVSYFNGEVARTINTSNSPIVVSDRGDSFLNKGNLISLSYLLDNDVRLLLLHYPPDSEILQKLFLSTDSNIFLYQPSGKLWSEIKSQKIQSSFVLSAPGLWKIKPY